MTDENETTGTLTFCFPAVASRLLGCVASLPWGIRLVGSAARPLLLDQFIRPELQLWMRSVNPTSMVALRLFFGTVCVFLFPAGERSQNMEFGGQPLSASNPNEYGNLK